MSEPVQISSADEFGTLLKASTTVVADFYADWCGPCHTIAPMFKLASQQLSRPGKISFVKVNTEATQDIAQAYQVTALPTFIIFKDQQVVERIQGADLSKLQALFKKLSAGARSYDAAGVGNSGGSGAWSALSPPKGYDDVTDQVDVRGLELLNFDNECGGPRVLFGSHIPSSLDAGKGKAGASSNGDEEGKDWVESDTDEQLMLFIPFQSTLKVRSLQLTSVIPGSSDADDKVPMRPKTVKIYSNRANVLGFDEADDLPATQSITLKPEDWNERTGTANVELRFVKFQNIYSLVIFVVDGEGDGEKVRLDRIRIMGEKGEAREQKKLEKVGEHE